MKAKGVANTPVVEVATPAVHLSRSDATWLVHKRCQHAGLVDAGLPEGGGQFVILAKAFAEQANVGHRHAQGVVRSEAVTRHSLAGALGGVLFQPLQRRLEFILERVSRFLRGLLRRTLHGSRESFRIRETDPVNLEGVINQF